MAGFRRTYFTATMMLLIPILVYSFLFQPPSLLPWTWTNQFLCSEFLTLIIFLLPASTPKRLALLHSKLKLKPLTEIQRTGGRLFLLAFAGGLPYILSWNDLMTVEEGPGWQVKYKKVKEEVRLKCLGSVLIMLLIYMVLRVKKNQIAMELEKEEAQAAAVTEGKLEEILARLDRILGENQTLKEELHDSRRSLEMVVKSKWGKMGAGEGGPGLLERLKLEE